MKKMKKWGSFFLIGMFLAMASMTGCTKKPNKDELTRVDEAKAAAESAEKKLSELRQERVQLENALQQKQNELDQSEAERDDVKNNVEK